MKKILFEEKIFEGCEFRTELIISHDLSNFNQIF